MRSLLTVVVMMMVGPAVWANDAATALTEARSLLSKRQFRQAAKVLTPAVESAAALEDADVREQALAAIHFYAAVAHSGAGDRATAKSHLADFFGYSPHARSIDRTKYDAQFVALFNELAPAAANSSPMSFAAVYSRFEPASIETPVADAGTWGTSPALDILASRAEKREWNDITSAADREAFIETFWKRRDPSPETAENEFRATFSQRVTFADRVFGSGSLRGSVTDRGKVFVLLGEPSSVRRRPLTRHDRIDVYMEDVMINGNVEQWVYGRDQLPIRISKDKIGYRFVTQAGIGDHALQVEDVFATQALIAATNPSGN